MRNKRGNSLVSSLLAFSIFLSSTILLMGAYNKTVQKYSTLIADKNEVVINEKGLFEFQ
ncbi:MAG: hypothetical protein PHI41_01020 [Erysipelotrichaceae bacterium]|nr:hypothetical protein [Erysipelotrichaceae bacterium]MDD3808724.1 hypothetical protein [Erysipelotrichaceae bacterium]